MAGGRRPVIGYSGKAPVGVSWVEGGKTANGSARFGSVQLSSAQLNLEDNSRGDRDFPCVSKSVCVSVCMCVGVCHDTGPREKRAKNSPVQRESEKNVTFMVRAVSHSSSPGFRWPCCY